MEEESMILTPYRLTGFLICREYKFVIVQYPHNHEQIAEAIF